MNHFLWLLAGYAFLGAVAMILANLGKSQLIKSQRWLKFVTYLLVVGAVILCIYNGYFMYLSILIAMIGLYEIIRTIPLAGRKAIVALLIYMLIVAGFFLFIYKTSIELQLVLYMGVLSFDAFGQLTGQLFGSRHFLPSVSPSKTIEGLLGAIFFCVLAVVLCHNKPWPVSVVLGLCIAAGAGIGDLLASWYKRIAGIKDYSNILPGQGGILDRFDSLLVAGLLYFLVGQFIE